jgi:hypothetical protein
VQIGDVETGVGGVRGFDRRYHRVVHPDGVGAPEQLGGEGDVAEACGTGNPGDAEADLLRRLGEREPSEVGVRDVIS